MFNKFVSWILGEAHKWHKIREVRYYDKAYGLFIDGYSDEKYRYWRKYVYHNNRCTQIDKLIYEMDGP